MTDTDKHREGPEATIEGNTRITLWDQVQWIRVNPRRIFWIWFLAYMLMIVLVMLLQSLRGAPYSPGLVTNMALEMLPFSLIILALAVLIPTVYFFKLKKDHKTVFYRIDAKTVEMSDSAGNKLQAPWSETPKAYRRGPYLLLTRRVGGPRVVPLRAFTPARREALLALLREKGLMP